MSKTMTDAEIDRLREQMASMSDEEFILFWRWIMVTFAKRANDYFERLTSKGAKLTQ